MDGIAGFDISFRPVDVRKPLGGKEMIQAAVDLVVRIVNHHVRDVRIDAGIPAVSRPALGDLENLSSSRTSGI